MGVDEIVTKILDSVEGILRYANFNVRYAYLTLVKLKFIETNCSK